MTERMSTIEVVATAIGVASLAGGSCGDLARAAIEAMRDMVPVVRENGEVVQELRGSPANIWAMMMNAALSDGDGENAPKTDLIHPASHSAPNACLFVKISLHDKATFQAISNGCG